MTPGPLLLTLPPLSPAVWTRGRRASLPFPLEEPGCRLYARARHALWQGVRTLGIEPGEEVLVPAYHHGSEVEALRRAGLRCAFYDVGDGLEPDVDELEAALGGRTRALQITHYLGFPQDADRWRRWCDRHGLWLIEDAAQAWLAAVGDRPVGAHGDLAIFCLYKTFGLPDGAAVVCGTRAVEPRGRPKSEALRLGLEHVAWLGGRSTAFGRVLGALHRPAAYDAAADQALGTPRPASHATRLVLPRIADPGAAQRRRANYAFLLERLRHVVQPAFATLPPGACPFVFPIAVADKSGLLRRLRASGIRATDLWSVPHPTLPADDFPRASALRRNIVALPVHQELRGEDLERIVAVVHQECGDSSARQAPSRGRPADGRRRRGGSPRGPAALAIAAILGMVLALPACSAVTGDRGDAPAGAAVGAANLPSALAAARPPRHSPTVHYTGPRGPLAGPVTLQAQARSGPARVVAVTFLLDGRPVGTTTTPPYRYDLDASLLPRGPHRLAVQAVDALGARATTRSIAISTGGRPRDVLEASPEHGLRQALAALARGHVTVRLAPGRYVLPELTLGDAARLVGSGPATVLAPARGRGSVVTVAGAHVRISDLAVDGAGAAANGIGIANGSHDVRVQRVRIGGMLVNGVEAWGVHTAVSVQDCAITGGGATGAGVVEFGSDRSRDTSVVRTTVSGFRGFGIAFAQREYRRPKVALHGLALDNAVADIDDPADASGTHEVGIWSGGVAAAIIGNRVRRTGTDGIQTVGSSTGVSIVDNDVAQTPVGIYVEHETNGSLIARNRIGEVTTGITVEWRYGGAGSSANTFAGNRIVEPSQAGVFVDVQSDRNAIARNVVVGGPGPPIVLQGSSHNLVVGNRSCPGDGESMVRQQSGSHDGGSTVDSVDNRLVDNLRLQRCPGP
jgi:hypothetical protein